MHFTSPFLLLSGLALATALNEGHEGEGCKPISPEFADNIIVDRTTTVYCHTPATITTTVTGHPVVIISPTDIPGEDSATAPQIQRILYDPAAKPGEPGYRPPKDPPLWWKILSEFPILHS